MLAHPHLEPIRIARWATAISVLLAFIGIFAALEVPNTNPFQLDNEYNVPAFWSFGVLLFSASVALLAGVSESSAAAGAFGAFVLFMAVDELLGIHESLERSTGVDWQTLYAPVVLVGAIAALLLMRRFGRGLPRLLLFAGGAAWFVAQFLEAVQWDGDRPVHGYYAMVIPEELFEMLGSLLFGLAVLVWARSRHRPAGRTT